MTQNLIASTGTIVGTNTYYTTGNATLECLVSPGATLPQRAHPTDAGADLFAWFEDEELDFVEIESNEQNLIDTGIAIKIPYGFGGFVYNRSSQGKKGIVIPHSVGVIDTDYRGTIKVLLKNTTNQTIKIMRNDRIAQLVIQPVQLVNFKDVWNDTQRGTGGFGSTGK
jgi:dUTP pyrophosphatase